MIHFYNTFVNSFNISSLFSREIIISSTFLEFYSIAGFGFTSLSAILFPINATVASAALWVTVLEAVFKAYSPASNNCFVYLFDKFLENDKDPYSLKYFLILYSIEQRNLAKFEESVISLY